MDTILITGGTGKFGRNFVKYFADNGYRVIFTSTDEARAQSLIDELDLPATVLGLEADLRLPNASSTLIRHIHDRGYKVSHLVNNARDIASLAVDEEGYTLREHFEAEYLMDVIVPYELATALYKTQADALKTVTNIGSQYGWWRQTLIYTTMVLNSRPFITVLLKPLWCI